MHAVLPHRIVMHVQSVNAIAWAIRAASPLRLRTVTGNVPMPVPDKSRDPSVRDASSKTRRGTLGARATLDSEGGAGILGDFLPLKDVVEVMLHVRSVILDQELQSHRGTRADGAARLEPVFGNPLNQVRKEVVVALPKIENFQPGHFLIGVPVHPGVLGVTGAAKLGLNRRGDKAHVIVRGRID